MEQPLISIIAAMDQKRGIGKNNTLPWHIPEDLKRFKDITLGHPVIMGRKTYNSIGKPLPKRTNIIVSSNQHLIEPGCLTAHSLSQAIEQGRNSPGSDEIFIIGGGQIFTQGLPFVNKLYLTIVQGDFNADVFFPDYSEFKHIKYESHNQFVKYTYTFLDLQR